MSLWGELRDHLVADATITAIVGERIRLIERSETLPAITFQRVIDLPQNTIDGAGTISITRVQIDLWGLDPDALLPLADAVRDRMNTPAATFKALPLGDTDEFEDDTRIYRILMEFDVHRQN